MIWLVCIVGGVNFLWGVNFLFIMGYFWMDDFGFLIGNGEIFLLKISNFLDISSMGGGILIIIFCSCSKYI